jgi:two-component system, OmpR family, phosphate regulon response regulator PhoB
MSKPKILVVDDETDLLQLVRYNLLKEGFEVFCAADGKTALELAWGKRPDLIILDWMLPDYSGLDICNLLKKELDLKKIPIIMLTARSSEQDRVSGFESGAEDYVVKPFSTKELVLRVKAMLGRTQSVLSEKLAIGALTLIHDEHRLMNGPETFPLTRIEFKIFATLAKTPNVVKTREQLLADIWEDASLEITDRAVDAHMKRLRAKLGDFRDYIETVRGVGYRLTIPT